MTKKVVNSTPAVVADSSDTAALLRVNGQGVRLSNRGRKRDDTGPVSRGKANSRAFRDRKAEYLIRLEEECRLLRRRNAVLEAQLKGCTCENRAPEELTEEQLAGIGNTMTAGGVALEIGVSRDHKAKHRYPPPPDPQQLAMFPIPSGGVGSSLSLPPQQQMPSSSLPPQQQAYTSLPPLGPHIGTSAQGASHLQQSSNGGRGPSGLLGQPQQQQQGQQGQGQDPFPVSELRAPGVQVSDYLRPPSSQQEHHHHLLSGHHLGLGSVGGGEGSSNGNNGVNDASNDPYPHHVVQSLLQQKDAPSTYTSHSHHHAHTHFLSSPQTQQHLNNPQQQQSQQQQQRGQKRKAPSSSTTSAEQQQQQQQQQQSQDLLVGSPLDPSLMGHAHELNGRFGRHAGGQ